MKERTVYIVTGHYGSGKSEFSINFARHLRSMHRDVCVCDLDVVNPYFRSREQRDVLEKEGITVVSDTMNSIKGLDMPYLSPAIKGMINRFDGDIILDCGGDDVGIRVLHQFKDDLTQHSVELLMAINIYRPQTQTPEQIIEMMRLLEEESGLIITGFVNTSNFLRQTQIDDVVKADIIINQVSEVKKVPICYVVGLRHLVRKLPKTVHGERIQIELALRDKWL